MQISTMPEPIGNEAGGLKLGIMPDLPFLFFFLMCLGSEFGGRRRRMYWAGFPGGRHWTLILCLPAGLRAKGVGLGVMGSFGAGVTEYSWTV